MKFCKFSDNILLFSTNRSVTGSQKFGKAGNLESIYVTRIGCISEDCLGNHRKGFSQKIVNFAQIIKHYIPGIHNFR